MSKNINKKHGAKQAKTSAEILAELLGFSKEKIEKNKLKFKDNHFENTQLTRGRGRPRKERTPAEILALQNKPQRGRGRPPKERTPEEILALQNKVKRGRGRPRKEKTPEEILSLLHTSPRGRGRPRKERTPAEILALQNKPQRGRGRPPKERTPEEILALQNKVKRGRGRPRKNELALTPLLQTTDHEELLSQVMGPEVVGFEKISPVSKEKKSTHAKPIQQLDENFVFPIFEELQQLNTKQALNKNSAHLSPHVLNLKNPISPKIINTQPILPPRPDYPYFNPDNWFDSFQYYNQPQQKFEAFETGAPLPTVRRFDTPTTSELPLSKIEFHKPPKKKNKSAIKLDFGKNYLPASRQRLARHNSTFVTLIKKIFSSVWWLIALPFRSLDFIVDRTLKALWWLVRMIVVSFFYLFKSLFINLKTLISGQKTLPTEKNYSPLILKFNYRPLLSFILICLIIVIPLGVLSWQQKNTTIKSQVLGKSVTGFEWLKNASEASKNFDWQQATLGFNQAYFDFKLAEEYLNNLDIFSEQIIKIIPQTATAGQLLTLGQLAAQLGQDLSNLANQLQNTNANESLTEKLRNIQVALEKIEPYFNKLLTITENLDIENLSKAVDQNKLEKLTLFRSSLPLIKQNFDNLKSLNNFLLNFLGGNQSKKYLVIFQNNSELRPTGGFMGSYALTEIKNGKIAYLEVPGGGFYDLKAATTNLVEAPKPFHLFSPYWQIWNANWFPDWPASAEKISNFYEATLAGVTVDGVIGLTPDILSDLLTISGPLELPAYKKTITADNLVQELQLAVEVEYDKQQNQPKKIIADLMPLVLDKVFNLPAQQSPVLLKVLNDNLKTKNILLWFKDPVMQAVIEDFAWSGKIQSTTGDYLMVIHTNIGGGKTDRVINNKLSHQVEVDMNGNIFDTVSLTRTHTGQSGVLFEDQNNVDYVRFYVPQGSQLIAADGFDYLPSNLFKVAADVKKVTPDSDLQKYEQNPILDETSNTRVTEEFGKTCFGNWLQVKPGEEKTVTLKYKLPFKLNKKETNWLDKIVNFIKPSEKNETVSYSLVAQKQPGLKSTDFTSCLKLPEKWAINNLGKSKNKPEINSNTLIYRDDLHTDGYYSVEIK